MGHNLLVIVAVLFACLSHSNNVRAESETLTVAKRYCKTNSCAENTAFTQAIRYPDKGGCVSVGDDLYTAQEFIPQRSSAEWWVLVPSNISKYEYRFVIEFAKRFTTNTGKQIYMAEPYHGGFESARKNYCVSVQSLGQKYLLVPKL